LAILVGSEGPADACGGTFCDGRPPPNQPRVMPVDQTGENILFVVDGKSVEAHVQIQYKGDPARFAWIVPMPAVPTVTAGSQQLFTNLLQGTVPSYGYQVQQDFCPSFNGFAPGGPVGAGGFTSSVNVTPAADAGVTVLFQKSVGAFEVTALQGHSSTEVLDWLSANGYQGISTAPAILDRYVQKGSVFVAVKLTAGAGSDEIHPLVFKYEGTEPCIPLELTAVAAVEDMGVRAFFLGTDRVVSTNYDQVTLNPARIDWALMGKNYDAVVSQAVDEAGGHAFVTEYAGTNGAVSRANLVNPIWDESAFVGLDARGVISELTAQGLLSCYTPGLPDADGGVCNGNHPLIVPLLHEFLPPPQGVRDGAYYSCISCYPQDAAAFDSQKLIEALHERIFEPARHAAAILSRWPYLTRLFTTISPSEMTLDPFFEARGGLPQVALPTVAVWRRTMTSASGFTLPGGDMVAMDKGLWPAFTSAMPWTAKIEEYPAGKAAKVVADNAMTIESELAKWNESQGWPLPPPKCSGPPSGVGGGQGGFAGTFGTGGARFGNGGTGVTGDAGTGPIPGEGPRASDPGCGCAVPGGSTQPRSDLWLATAGALTALSLRRRASRKMPLR
jgi:MYXO-CTERM domain-containing protein